MAIRKKSNEELKHQAEWFLDYSEKNWKIKEKQRTKISKILWLNNSEKKRFLERFFRKNWKEIDIWDKQEIEKILKKKHIDFDTTWKEYTKYLHKKSVDKHNDEIKQKVEVFFQPYRTPDEKVNDKIINIITENYSKATLGKARLFLESKYLKVFLDKTSFEYYILWNIDFDNLQFMLDNFGIDGLEIIRLSPYERITTDNTTWVKKSIYYNIWEYEIDTIKENVSLLKRIWFNYKNFNLNELKDENIKKYVEIIDNCDLEWFRRDFNPEGENPELKDIFIGYRNLTRENMLKECIASWPDKIDRVLSKAPNIDYENNWWYTSKYVHMFWLDSGNNGKMADYLGWRSQYYASYLHYEISDYWFLAFLWTVYWTNNWKKNINLMFDEWYLWMKEVMSYNEYIYGDKWNNEEIAKLKLINNDILKLLAKNIKSENDFKILINLFRYAESENINKIFEKYPDIQISELILLENENTHILSYAEPENLNKIFEEYPDIQINELTLLENEKEDIHILSSADPENLKKVLINFWPLDFTEINQYKKLFCFNRQLPTTLNFKEEYHKWYLNFLNEVLDTNYDSDKKSKMIAKVVTLTFEQAHNYVEVFKMLDDSISMDIQRVKNELIDELLETDNPKEDAQQIINIFERNNLPLTGKIFKVFELLYPRGKFKNTLQVHWSPVLHQYLDEWKNVYDLIYKDLMNIAIKSWDRSLRDYINTFVWVEKLLKKFEDIVSSEWFLWNEPLCLDKKLSEDEQAKLLYLFRRISVLYNRYYWKEINEWNTIEDKKYWESTVADNQLVEFYNDIKKWFHLRKWDSIYDRLQRFLLWLWYHSFDEVLKDMEKSKKGAHERWLKLYNETLDNWWKIKFPRGAFLKWVDEDAFSKIINRWVTCREYLWWWDNWTAARSDSTPFDIDWLYIDSPTNWNDYGNVLLITDTNRCNIIDTRNEWLDWYKENQYELFKTWVVNQNHYWIRTWIPTTEVDYIIFNWSFDRTAKIKNSEWEYIEVLSIFQNMCYEIARNWYYIPIVDNEWNVKFTPEMYHKIRLWFNYMQYYDGFDVEQVNWKWVSKESDNKINKGYNGTNDKITDDWLRKLVSDNSPSNEKYNGFSKENRELAENTIERIKEILENQCWIKFNSKHDSSITWAELHDSWSTWRWTDIPTKDVDLDFTLLLDANDYNEKLELIKETIYRETGTLDKEWEWPRTWWFQMKSKKNKIGQGPERPDWISLDLLILKKSQVIDYSSSDAMKEKLDYINDNLWEEDLDRVRTNVIIMKKLLKAKWCYKKPEWWISWIWVENWITQNHWSFIEALESFEEVAYWWKYEEWKQPLPLKDFQEWYPIYDAWENYKDWCNDNFVYKLKENGYKWTLEIVQVLRLEWLKGIMRLIKEYEKKKKEYTG